MPSPLDFGVDVSKDSLQVTCAESPMQQQQVANQRASIRTWLAQLPSGSRVAMEATGAYHRLLADLAHAQGMQVYVLNPCDLRHYARAVGARSKTDRVDANVIARYLARELAALHPYRPPTPAQRHIDGLLRRRATVVASKTQLRLSLASVTGCRRELLAVLQRLDAILAKIDHRLAHFAAAQAADQQRLQSVLGIGPLTSMALTNLFTRVPLRDGDAAVAFVGLDPRAKDSGRSIGQRRLSKRGPAELRRLLFNAARSASKTSLWRPLYMRYRARGLSTTEATIILARKLLRVAHSIYRHGTNFDSERFARA